MRARSALTVQAWLNDDAAMVAYGGPADLALTLDSIGAAAEPAFAAAQALERDGKGLGQSLAHTLEDSDEDDESGNRGGESASGGDGGLGETLTKTLDSDDEN